MVGMDGAVLLNSPLPLLAPGTDLEIMTVMVEGKRIKLLITDTSGKERFRKIATAYYRACKVNSSLLLLSAGRDKI